MTEINNQNLGDRNRKNRPDRRREARFDREERLDAGRNLSWGSIIAGAVSGAAVFTVLSLLTAALGFGIFSANSANPLSGIGVATGIWTVITLVISFCAGGFIAGYSARSTGLLHGAITWAVTILLLFTLVFNALTSALGMAGNAVGAVAGGAASVAGDVAGGAANVADSAISSAVEQVSNNLEATDTEELKDNLNQYLADTDVKELQPEYIDTHIQESKDEIAQTVKNIALNPENAGEEIKSLTDSLTARAEDVASAADEDAITNAVAENSDLSQAEAEEIGSNIYNQLNTAAEETSKAIDSASKEINKLAEDAKITVNQTAEDVKDGADKATNAVSVGSVLSFLGLILALAISAIAGRKGEEYAIKNYR